ncbi:MAG: hypothetical protein ACREMK_11105 [Gemmatimonadota bacterium]
MNDTSHSSGKETSLFVGWLDDDIPSFVGASSFVFASFPFILITSLDSSMDVYNLKAIQLLISKGLIRPRPVGESCLITGEEFVELCSSSNIFTGFDEVWCFNHVPYEDKPHDVTIVPPIDIDDQIVRGIVKGWMRKSGALMGLGDGVGMNYAISNEMIANAVLKSKK